MAAMKALAVSERERGQGFSWMCCLVLCSRWCGMVSPSANPYLCSLLGFRARRERERVYVILWFAVCTAHSLSISVLIPFLNTWGFTVRERWQFLSLSLRCVS